MDGFPIVAVLVQPVLALPPFSSSAKIRNVIVPPRMKRGNPVGKQQHTTHSGNKDEGQPTEKVIRKHFARLLVDWEQKVETYRFESDILRPHRSLLLWIRARIKNYLEFTGMIRQCTPAVHYKPSNTYTFCRGGHIDHFVKDKHTIPKVDKPHSGLQVSKKTKLYASCLVIVMIWITIGTLFYSRFYGWPLSQSFFYAVDAGMSIGFCTGEHNQKVSHP